MSDEEDLHRREIPHLSFNRLKVLSALGRGAKGVVFLVKDEDRDEFLALKVISKALIEKKGKAVAEGNEYRRVCFEQGVLSLLRHPLFPRLRGVLDTDKLVGYAIDYCPGRDLNVLRKRQSEKMFSDDIIRFYAAELVIALEYLHKLGIAYRDLKPENVMVQENGHIMMVDFDLSTKLSPRTTPASSPCSSNSVATSRNSLSSKKRPSPFHRLCNSGISPEDLASMNGHSENSARAESDSTEKSNSFVGTEEYVAPEIISGEGHNFAVDWWSLGVLLYEMLYGVTPFKGSNRKETFYRILTKTPDLNGEATPLRDLIRKLLEKDPKQRIELEEIKGHDFFRGMDWESVVQISRPPFIPENVDNDIEGNNNNNTNIDVESVVQGIFQNGDVEKNKKTDQKQSGDYAEIVNNKKVWNGAFNHHPTQTENFLVF
ncbi:serine/threonine-protein kinase OXI1-like [Humulus lupulus]|uniref:serine/threonine-protein kinase OXI1-like n=1 Tax=Humulus lupulus TaxID=3486 RepID=UPI002B411A0D|nr:serine/threonine-protein kinase OXI1-like [Humulus lupulus]